MTDDVRGTAEYQAVAEHLGRWHEPAFGRPHALSEPHVTSDGGRVVVTGSAFDELVGRPRTVIYTVTDGELTAVTGGTGSARRGRFSPDGSRLAFLSDRAGPGVFQLFVLGRDFGEAVAAPHVSGTVEYAEWSPDGKRIVMVVAGLGAELAGTQGSGSNVAITRNLPKWHPIVEHGAHAESARRRLWLYDVVANSVAQLSHAPLNCWEASWCGNDHVLAVTSDSPDEDSWYEAVLTLLEIRTGEHRVVLRSDVQLGWAAGSPDGRYAAIVQAVCSDRMLVAGNLTVVDLASGRQSVIDTAATDVTWLHWVDGERLGYLGLRRLDSVAGIVEVGNGAIGGAGGVVVEEVFSTAVSCGGGRYPDGAFTKDGRVVVVQHAYDMPPQLVLIGGEGGAKEDVLASTANRGADYLLSVAGNAEVVTWRAPDGLDIDGLFCTPPGPGPFALVLNVHGGPISAFRNTWSMSYPWVPLLVSRGYAVLNPNPRGSAGRGQEFAGRVVGDMGGADTQDYLSGLDFLVERGVVDPGRIGVMGGSYGGFMSSWLVTQDQRFAAAVPISPVTDWYSFGFTSNVAGWSRAFLRADPEHTGTLIRTRSPVL